MKINGAPCLKVDIFFQELDKVRIKKKATWRKVSQRIGIHQSCFTRLKHGYSPSAEVLVRLLSWSGLSAKNFFVQNYNAEKRDS
jgi:hypothetical protein